MAPQQLPSHLRRYLVTQDYEAYTPRDQAVWRHILRRLTSHLEGRAHPAYLQGLAATGIDTERIPSLEGMNRSLASLGWRAGAVRGFIPPAVFTELQSLGFLAIAADIRSHEHVEYTPAPDIVHESAGHAPILADPTYSRYLRRCGVAGFKAIASREDQGVFQAIRQLSVVKEDPASSSGDLARAQEELAAAQEARTYVSENTRASRLYWWTAEYGLVGSPEDPRIYGAGLLSSVGESERCLGPQVERVPLSLACVDRDYDITAMQPLLYVARDFRHLFQVLDEFEATLAWRRGGDYGLEEALRARTVNHLVLADGTEVTGRVARLFRSAGGGEPQRTRLALLEGPCLVSRQGKASGAPWAGDLLVAFGPDPLPDPGPLRLEGPDFLLTGRLEPQGLLLEPGGSFQGEALALPDRLLCFTSQGLPSVAGGPADPEAWDQAFGDADPLAVGEAEAQVRRRKAQALPPALASLYQELRRMREEGAPCRERLAAILDQARAFPGDWLLRREAEELMAPLDS
jgi:phenylalanine-4-hydroxylase